MKKTALVETVSNTAIKDLVETCRTLGVLNDHDLDKLAIKPSTLNDPLLRYSEKKLIELWSLIYEKSELPEIGLIIGQTINPEAKGLLANWVSQAESIAEAIEIFRTNISLMNPSEHWNVQKNEHWCSLIFSLCDDKAYPAIAIERSMSAMVAWGRTLSGHTFPIKKACFTFDRPAYHDRFTAIFGHNIQYNMHENSLKFDRELLSLPLANGNSFLKSLIEDKAKSSLSALTKDYSFASKTKTAIKDILSRRSSISIDAVCAELAISRQTLYRKLKDEGCDYKSLSEDYKKAESLRLLHNKSENIMSISLRLGFKDTSSFYKAFKRWFGMSPKTYMQNIER